MRILPYVLILGLLGGLALQQQKFERLERAAAEADARAAAARASSELLGRYKQALELLAEGKDQEAGEFLETLARENPKDPLAAHARAQAESIRRRAARLAALAVKRRERRDLGKLLDAEAPAPAPEPEDDSLAEIEGCAPLQADSAAYAGRLVRLTARVRRKGAELAFPGCPLVRISTARMKPARRKTLLGRFSLEPERDITLTGRFKATILYPD